MQLIQNIHASTSTYTALTRWLRYTCTHTCTHSLYSHLPVCSSPPSLWCSCSKLSWALMEGLSRWHRQPTLIFYWTLFVLFILRRRCAATHGLTHSFRLKWSNIPSCRERVIQTYEKKWCGKWFGLFLFLPFKFHFTNTWRRLVMFALLSLHRHPKVSWGVPGRGRIRGRVRVPGGKRRRGDQRLLVGAAHCQCPWGSGSGVLLQQVRCSQLSWWN